MLVELMSKWTRESPEFPYASCSWTELVSDLEIPGPRDRGKKRKWTKQERGYSWYHSSR